MLFGKRHIESSKYQVSNPEIPLLGIYQEEIETHQCTEQVYS